MDRIDLRSDTVTWPTPTMQDAMAHAAVGDDVYGEDPTGNELEDLAATLLGKEAGLFVPSGTMANLVAVFTTCGRSDEAIMGDKSHLFASEVGSVAGLGGIQPRTLTVQSDGTFCMDALRAAIRDPHNVHHPTSRLISLENAQCGVGGIPLTAEYTAAVGALAAEHSMKLHVDGSRIFNAAVALGCSAAELAAPADSVSFCISKGLCAPVGALVVGDADFIQRARRTRKALGGGMRQAGVLAAAGLIALREMVDRLAEDHATARQLADGLAAISGLVLDPTRVRINMVLAELAPEVSLDAYQVAERLQGYGIWVGVRGERKLRLVTHYWIKPEAIEQTIAAFAEVVA
jgi:threonine aldolase